MNKQDLKALTFLKTNFQESLNRLEETATIATNLLGYDVENERAGDWIWDYLNGSCSQKDLIKQLKFIQK